MADGDSPEEAIKIDISNELEGAQAKYSQIASRYGRKNKDWRVESQKQIERDDKFYDVMTVVLTDGSKKEVYFDTTEYFAK